MKPIEDRLAKVNLSITDYKQHIETLIQLQYTEAQANKIIIRRSSKNTIAKVVEHTLALKKHFTAEQIVQIAAHDGGSKNIEAVKTSYEALKALDFTAEQIVQIAAHDGGSKNIEAVKTSYEALKALDFTAEQIVQIAAHHGGSKNIEAVKTSYEALKALDFTAEQIVQIAAHHGGSKNIEAVKTSYEALKALDFTAEQIVRIASNNGGSKNIEAVKTSYEALKALDFTAEQIVQIAAHHGGSKNIEAVKTSYKVLKALDFTVEQIVQIASHIAGSKNIEAVKTSYEVLKALDLTAEQIVKTVARNSGWVKIETVQGTDQEAQSIVQKPDSTSTIEDHAHSLNTDCSAEGALRSQSYTDFTIQSILAGSVSTQPASFDSNHSVISKPRQGLKRKHPETTTNQLVNRLKQPDDILQSCATGRRDADDELCDRQRSRNDATTEDNGYSRLSTVLGNGVSVTGKPETHRARSEVLVEQEGSRSFKKRSRYECGFFSKQALGLSGGTTSVSSLGTHGVGQSGQGRITYDSIGAMDLSLPKP